MNKNFIKLLKTNGEKMSVFRLSTMLMKTKELNYPLHDVDENKCSYRMGAQNSELGVMLSPWSRVPLHGTPERKAMPATSSSRYRRVPSRFDGAEKDPSPALLRRAPSPLGEG